MQTILDQSIEQMRIESRVRIEQFKKEEEKKLQSFITLARLENDKLWTKIVKVSKEEKAKLPSLDVEQPPLIKRKENNESSNNHVHFAPELNNYQDQPHPKSLKRASFTLDNTAISSLRNMNLENQISPSDKDANLVEESHVFYCIYMYKKKDEDDEDIFNLDEEFSDEEDKESKNDDDEKEDDLDYAEDGERENNQLLISASLKNSISQIDRKFSWIKKKRNTSKYIPHDFDIKSNFKREDANSNNNEKPVTIYATSMPITIHYPINEDIKEEKEKEEEEEANKTNKMRKNDILASSFANYNISSFSDKQLSDQFPAPRRRKSLATSSSLIRPQLDSVVGKSLDTRGLLKKKVNEAESNYASDDDFDSSLPPHVWAAMETIDENNADE
ncbi:MAG: hypothetical protein EXX96DRAFT_217653 [Benjaminiella poitrasii]|nr:MAG: hypothetical protein EXX96DRAFT_217653 [Benjaminiella poitrasii]